MLERRKVDDRRLEDRFQLQFLPRREDPARLKPDGEREARLRDSLALY
jgi:hypothetical protein